MKKGAAAHKPLLQKNCAKKSVYPAYDRGTDAFLLLPGGDVLL